MLRKPKPEDLKLTNAINDVLDRMATVGPDTPEYPKLIVYLARLTEMKQNQKTARRVSPDQIALVLGNFAGIVFIVAYEHGHVLTSKALSLLVKVK